MNIEIIQEMRAMVAIVGTLMAACACAWDYSTLPPIRLQSDLADFNPALIRPNPS